MSGCYYRASRKRDSVPAWLQTLDAGLGKVAFHLFGHVAHVTTHIDDHPHRLAFCRRKVSVHSQTFAALVAFHCVATSQTQSFSDSIVIVENIRCEAT